MLCSISSALCQLARKDSLRSELRSELSVTERIDVLHELGGILANKIPDSALIHAKEAFQLTESLDDVKRHSRSFRRMGHALYSTRDLDAFRSSLLSYIAYCEKTDQPKQIAATYRNLSKIGERLKQPDSTLYYLDKCIDILSEHPDTIILIDVYLSKGLANKYKGSYDLSIDNLLQGMRISENLERPYKLGYLNQNIAITYAMMDQYQESAEHSRIAIRHFIDAKNQRGITRTQGNLGLAYVSLDSIDQAIVVLKEAIASSKKSKMPSIAMHSHASLSDIYVGKEEWDKALYHLDQQEVIANDIEHEYALGSIARSKAHIAIKKGDKNQANRYKELANQYLDSHREPSEESSLYFGMSKIHEGTADYKRSLDFYKKGVALRDSIFTLEKEEQFEELNLVYQTEKKDAEITLLNKNAVIDNIKQQRLWGGLGLLGISSLAFMYGLRQRANKKQALLIREKEIETEKRQKAEEELESKKKELITKALQLSKKNEFLMTLEEEVNQLKQTVGQSISSAAGRIDRMIYNNELEEEEWDQFSKEFSSVHQDFITSLTEKYGSFSQSEMRLASLLKMNLSSKDIANILRISDAGIKKARYRLRKKMSLESGDDLQGTIHGL